MAQITQSFFLKNKKMLTKKVCYLTFERGPGESFSFIAGQFMTFQIPGPTKTLNRSYSIANAPNNRTIEIACALVEGGVASQFFADLKPGDAVQASGPYGLLVLTAEQPQRYILVATGTGVTPYRAMLPELHQRLTETGHVLKVDLVLGVRHPEELLFADEFNAFAAQHKNFQFHACYSQASMVPLQPFEYHGRVQTCLNTLMLNPTQDIVYLCGNPNMIDDNFALCTELGFERKNIRREKYVFSR